MVSKERFLAFLAAKRRLQWAASLGAAVVWMKMLVLGSCSCLGLRIRLGAYVERCDRLTARGSLCRHLCWCCGEGLLLLAQEGCSGSDSSSGCDEGSSAGCDSQGGGHCGQVLMEKGVVVCSDKQVADLYERGETGRLRSSQGCSSSSIASGWGLGDITAGGERMSCRVNDWTCGDVVELEALDFPRHWCRSFVMLLSTPQFRCWR
jgi:hypothetical protein